MNAESIDASVSVSVRWSRCKVGSDEIAIHRCLSKPGFEFDRFFAVEGPPDGLDGFLLDAEPCTSFMTWEPAQSTRSTLVFVDNGLREERWR